MANLVRFAIAGSIPFHQRTTTVLGASRTQTAGCQRHPIMYPISKMALGNGIQQRQKFEFCRCLQSGKLFKFGSKADGTLFPVLRTAAIRKGLSQLLSRLKKGLHGLKPLGVKDTPSCTPYHKKLVALLRHQPLSPSQQSLKSARHLRHSHRS